MIYLIAKIKENGQEKYKLLNYNVKTKEAKTKIVSLEELKKYNVENVKVEKNEVKGINGSIDRYTEIENREYKKKSIVILGKIKDADKYIICSATGEVEEGTEADIIEFLEKHREYGIANGKIVEKDRKYLSAIEGEYMLFEQENEIVKEEQTVLKKRVKKQGRYVLMHKNIQCLVFEVIDWEITHAEIKDYENLPLIFHIRKNEKVKNNLQLWISRRIIPASRMKYDRLVECLKISDFERLEFVLENKALSLTDCYWVKKENSNDNWENINYYKNDFNQDLISIYLDSTISPEYRNLIPLTPSNTLDGYLPKAWVIKNGERWLYKRSSIENREILNEVICSRILKAIGLECVEYIMTDYKGKISSACKCIGNENIDIISANDFTNLYKRTDETDIGCVCRTLKEIYGNDNKFYEMVQMDFILANRDRHWNNFSFIRNADTLKYIGFAPIYDNGNSLWYNRELSKIGTNDDYLMFSNTKLFDIKNKILKGRLEIPKEKIRDKLEIILQSEYEEERKQRIYAESCRWLEMLFSK